MICSCHGRPGMSAYRADDDARNAGPAWSSKTGCVAGMAAASAMRASRPSTRWRLR